MYVKFVPAPLEMPARNALRSNAGGGVKRLTPKEFLMGSIRCNSSIFVSIKFAFIRIQ